MTQRNEWHKTVDGEDQAQSKLKTKHDEYISHKS
jgi:hypothetical protein